jgi:hypothetical protein
MPVYIFIYRYAYYAHTHSIYFHIYMYTYIYIFLYMYKMYYMYRYAYKAHRKAWAARTAGGAGSIQALHLVHACLRARVLACTRSVRAGCPRETTPPCGSAPSCALTFGFSFERESDEGLIKGAGTRETEGGTDRDIYVYYIYAYV